MLPSTSNIRAAAASEASKKKRTSKDPTKPLGRKPYPCDENGKIIRPATKTTIKQRKRINFFFKVKLNEFFNQIIFIINNSKI